MSHTPGPWEAWSEEGETKSGRFLHSICRTDVRAAGYGEETFHECVAEARGVTGAQARDNAVLIAAAPELLEALREMVKDVAIVCDKHGMAHPANLLRAKAAIAKAEGA